jgi:multidrug efflux pump subunit AcrA (membrane-fusion protein)
MNRFNPGLRTVLLLAVSFAACTGCKSREAAVTPQVSVQLASVTVGSIAESIETDAVLTPLAEAAIQPKVTSPVQHFLVQRGDRVHAGQLLLTLENKDLAAAAQDNEGAYQAAQAAYATSIKSTVPEDFTRADYDLKQAKADYDLNQSIVTARQKLFQQGAIPGRDLDTARNALLQAKATLDLAQAHYNALQTATHEAAIQAARGQLQSASGRLQNAKAMLSYTEIRSPIDGYITDRPLFDGETAQVGTPVITVMDTSALIAKVHISQMQAASLFLGSKAALSVPGISDPYPAKVILISPALDPGSSTIEIWVRAENPHQILKAGTPVHVSITGKSVDHATILPVEALQTAEDGSHFVMLVSAKSTALRRPVTVGIVTAKQVQILSGIVPTDKVISVGSYALDPDTPVTIAAPTATDDSDGDKQ